MPILPHNKEAWEPPWRQRGTIFLKPSPEWRTPIPAEAGRTGRRALSAATARPAAGPHGRPGQAMAKAAHRSQLQISGDGKRRTGQETHSGTTSAGGGVISMPSAVIGVAAPPAQVGSLVDMIRSEGSHPEAQVLASEPASCAEPAPVPEIAVEAVPLELRAGSSAAATRNSWASRVNLEDERLVPAHSSNFDGRLGQRGAVQIAADFLGSHLGDAFATEPSSGATSVRPSNASGRHQAGTRSDGDLRGWLPGSKVDHPAAISACSQLRDPRLARGGWAAEVPLWPLAEPTQAGTLTEEAPRYPRHEPPHNSHLGGVASGPLPGSPTSVSSDASSLLGLGAPWTCSGGPLPNPSA